MERCQDLDHPRSWLKTVKNKDSSRPPLFDSHRMIKSMLLLRKSELSKRLFGEDEDFRVSNEEDEGEIVGGRSEALDIISNSRVIPSTSHSRKRKSPDVEEPNSSTPKVIKKGDDAIPVPAESSDQSLKSKKLSITRAPQQHLPFNYKDLVLRVGMNWGKRLRDSTTMMFTLDLPDIFRPLLNLSYPESNDDDDDDNNDDDDDGDSNGEDRGFHRFLRRDRSHSLSENDNGADSASTFSSSSTSSSSSDSDSSHILDDGGGSPEEASGSRPPTPFPT
ncbi:hypothetical protein ACTXT7_014659 [Hymenolepis weldensis]